MPATPIDLATAVANALDKFAGLIAAWVTAQPIKRLQYRVEAAMNYVHVVRKFGEYKDLPDEKREELMIHFEKRIFDES